jgi:aspartyl-tRNA(Asn)/glutamyl-tRNA(Gln) amidotransferase subunit C
VAVTPDDVLYIAGLARIGLDPARVPQMVGELNGILEHMEVISRVDVGGATRLDGHVTEALRAREDAGAPQPLDRPTASFAPEMADGFFLVPRLASHTTEPEAAP